MYTRHLEIPVYEFRQTELDATLYNAVRLGLKRIDSTIRLQLTGLRTLELILQDDAWIVVDRALNDMPVIAWSQFERSDELSLHQPIQCGLRLFHIHATLVLERILDETQQTLESLIHQDGDHKVLTFPDKGKMP